MVVRHRSAWLDSPANHLCHQFFRDTLETLDNTYLRPTFNGYIVAQEAFGRIVRDFLCDQASPDQTLDRLDGAYREVVHGQNE